MSVPTRAIANAPTSAVHATSTIWKPTCTRDIPGAASAPSKNPDTALTMQASARSTAATIAPRRRARVAASAATS